MPPSPHSILREACLQMRKKKLCGDDDVIEDDKVAAEAVAAAELCQHQMHLVHTRRCGRKRDREGRIQGFRNIGQIF